YSAQGENLYTNSEYLLGSTAEAVVQQWLEYR
nr:18K protein - sheep (fragments) [Ovis aries]